MQFRSTIALFACVILGGCGGSGDLVRTGECIGPEQCTHEADTPSRGLYSLQQNLVWHEAVIPAENGALEQRMKWAQAVSGGGECLIFIAGAVGDPNAVDLCDRGVVPPARTPSYRPGLGLTVDRGGAGAAERATIRGGFLVAFSSRCASLTPGMRWDTWPLVIGTRHLTAAAETGRFVFLAVPDHDGTSLRECVFRPNQRSASDMCDSPDADTEEGVHVDWSDRAGHEWHFHLYGVSYIDLMEGDAKERPVDGDEARFLRDVCRFVDRAWPHMTGDAGRTGCP